MFSCVGNEELDDAVTGADLRHCIEFAERRNGVPEPTGCLETNPVALPDELHELAPRALSLDFAVVDDPDAVAQPLSAEAIEALAAHFAKQKSELYTLK